MIGYRPGQPVGAVVFDCDGVILESMRAKGDAFRQLFDGEPAHQDAIEAFDRGLLRMDPERHTCTWKNEPVTLTVTEFLILQALAQRPGVVKSRNALMDAAYDSRDIRIYSLMAGRKPLIDLNARGADRAPFAPHEAQRYKARSTAERVNGRLKDEFGGRNVYVRGHAKVMAHLMFGILALTVDQLIRLVAT